jgi:GAF domain-containing protein
VREARITAINQRIQSAMSIDDVLQIAVSELGEALDANQANIELSMIAKQNRDSATRN